MLITRVERGRGKRYRVYGEDLFLFALYSKELSQYHIEEGSEITDEVVIYLKQELVLKRAKERALYLLERRPYPTSQMRNKLRGNDYSDEVIDEVIRFLTKYRYLDDEEYVRMYIEDHSARDSRQKMLYDLMVKGVDKAIVETYFFKHENDLEAESFRKCFERYTQGKDLKDPAVRQKVFRYMYGKGYSIGLIENGFNKYKNY